MINKTTSVSVTLEPGAVTQVVEVASASLTVDTTASSVNTDISDTFYQNIPCATKRCESLLLRSRRCFRYRDWRFKPIYLWVDWIGEPVRR